MKEQLNAKEVKHVLAVLKDDTNPVYHADKSFTYSQDICLKLERMLWDIEQAAKR